MRCPFCNSEETQVKDSRPADDGSSIRRRRACASCGARFTTFERVQLREIAVVKSDGRMQPFDREKIFKSMQIALRKRPVKAEDVEAAVNEIVRTVETMGEAEIESTRIGELVMKTLARLDSVGFIRFASVYKEFSRPEDFHEFLGKLDSQDEVQDAAE